eukprot:COSAG01_NODE_536_length_15768_cov_58.648286_15_plen_72_part_00
MGVLWGMWAFLPRAPPPPPLRPRRRRGLLETLTSGLKLAFNNRNQQVNLKSTRRIPQDGEIFVHYGPSYWR